jgi:hypothetical protein
MVDKSPVRDGRRLLLSLTGLGFFPNCEPSHEWLGYCQKHGAAGTAAKVRRGTTERGGREAGEMESRFSSAFQLRFQGRIFSEYVAPSLFWFARF